MFVPISSGLSTEFFLIVFNNNNKVPVSSCQFSHSFLRRLIVSLLMSNIILNNQAISTWISRISWISIIWITLIMLGKAATIWLLNIQLGKKKSVQRVLFFLLCFPVPKHLPLGLSCLNVKIKHLKVPWRNRTWLTSRCVACACWVLL